MGPLFLAFTFFSWLIITVLGGIYDAQGTETSVMNQIVTFQIFREQEASLGGLLSFTFPVPNLTWFRAVGQALIWDVSWWAGWAQYIRIPLLLSLTFGFVGSLMLSVFSSRLIR